MSETVWSKVFWTAGLTFALGLVGCGLFMVWQLATLATAGEEFVAVAVLVGAFCWFAAVIVTQIVDMWRGR